MSKVVKGINKNEEVNVIDWNKADEAVKNLLECDGVKKNKEAFNIALKMSELITSVVTDNKDELNKDELKKDELKKDELKKDELKKEEIKTMKIKESFVGTDETIRIELNKFTAAALKAAVKEAGLKGLSGKKKAELIEIMIKNKDLFMDENVQTSIFDTNNVESNNAELSDMEAFAKVLLDAMNEEKNADAAAIETLKEVAEGQENANNNCLAIDSDNKKEFNFLSKTAAQTSYKRALTAHLFNKSVKTKSLSGSIALEYYIVREDNKYFVKPFESIRVAEESSLSRVLKDEECKIADNMSVFEGNVILETLDISFNKNLLDMKKKNTKTLLEGLLDNLKDGIYIKYNRMTGLFSLVHKDDAMNKAGDEIRKYEFLGITPSGLRSASFKFAVTEVHYWNGIGVNCDRRKEILNDASSGSFVENFLEDDGSTCIGDKLYQKVSSGMALFKEAIRATQCMPPSKDLFTVDNYVLVNNLGATAINKKGEYQKDVNDGNIFVSADAVARKHTDEFNSLNLTEEGLEGLLVQNRGDSAKSSASFVSQNNMKTLIKKYILDQEYTIKNKLSLKDKRYLTIDVIVIDNVRYTYEEFMELPTNKKVEFYNKLEVIGDRNAFKLKNTTNKWMFTILKVGKKTGGKLGQVLANAMLNADVEEGKNVLLDLGKKSILKEFRKYGINFSLTENGNINTDSFDLESIKRLNNSPQLVDYLLASDPEFAIKMLPSIFTSSINNTSKGLSNMINLARIDIDTEMMPVLTDRGALFGLPVLDEHECYINNSKHKECLGARHPISGARSFTFFNMVSKTELLKRIVAITDEDIAKALGGKEQAEEIYGTTIDKVASYIRRFISDSFLKSQDTIFIGASHFLMEKHDGMDFDIDTMQLIYERSILDLMKKSYINVGSMIDSADNGQRLVTLRNEHEIIEGRYIPVQEYSDIEINNLLNGSSSVATTEEAGGLESILKSNELTKSPENIFKHVLVKHFTNEVAQVGEIVTEFYNNFGLLIALKASYFTEEQKEKIAEQFRRKYKCDQKRGKKYNRVIKYKKVGDHYAYKVNKKICIKVIQDFAASKGTVEDIINFLADCVDCNRYLAETAIDAPKNAFNVSNMFKHSDIVIALGSDKNMEIVQASNKADEKGGKTRSDLIFSAVFTELGLAALGLKNVNDFRIQLITDEKKGVGFDKIDEQKALEASQLKAGKRDVKIIPLYVIDPLAEVKLELVKFANKALVMTSVLYADKAFSEEAEAFRTKIKAEALKVEGANQLKSYIYSLMNTYAAVTVAIKEAANREGQQEITDNISPAEYLKKIAVKACRNSALLGVAEIDPGTVGLMAVAVMLECNSKTGNRNKGTMNPALFKILEKELITFAMERGAENVGFIAEEIDTVFNKDGVVPNSKIEEESFVEVEDGMGVICDTDYIVKTSERRANIEGSIIKNGNKLLIVTEKEFAEEDLSVGSYFASNNNQSVIIGETNMPNPSEKFETVKYVFVREYVSLNEKFGNIRFYNVIVAIDSQGYYKVVGSIFASEDVQDFFENQIELTPENLLVLKTKTGTPVFHLGGEDFQSLLKIMTEESSFDLEDLMFENVTADSLSVSIDGEDESQAESNTNYGDENKMPTDLFSGVTADNLSIE